MPKTLTLTIDRTSLELPDLVITNAPTGDGLFISSVNEPTFDVVYNRAEADMFSNGRPLLSATLDVGDLPAVLLARGSTWAAVEGHKATLIEALWQFTFPLSLAVDGVARSWSADPARPAWGEIRPGDVSAFLATASVSIPLNPA